MQRRALLWGLSALAVACGEKPRPAPPPAPVVRSASDMIPEDLDVVVRLDWARMKGALGGLVLSGLAREVLARGGGAGEELLVSSLLAADTVYLAYRPSPLLMPLDRVLALQGRFEPIVAHPSGFSGGVDRGGDFRYWDRQGAKAERGSVARIYALGDRVRAFASEAELDSVERVISGQASERRLQPPEEGTLSLAARSWLLARLTGRGALREMMQDSKQLELVVDLESDEVSLKADLRMSNASQAEQLARALQAVLPRLEGRLGQSPVLRADGDRVVLSTKLTRAALVPALGCLRSGAADCSW